MADTCDVCGTFYWCYSAHLAQNKLCRPAQVVVSEKPAPVCKEAVNNGWFFERVAQEELTQATAWALMKLRCEDGWTPAMVGQLKKTLQPLLKLRDRLSHGRLVERGIVGPHISIEETQEALDRDLFAGIESEAKELSVLKETVPYVEPRVVKLSSDPKDIVVSRNFGDMLTMRLQNEPKFRRQCLAASKRWKSGELWCEEPEVLKDLEDGVKARFDEDLMRPARPEEQHDLRIGLVFNNDDSEASPHSPHAFAARVAQAPRADRARGVACCEAVRPSGTDSRRAQGVRLQRRDHEPGAGGADAKGEHHDTGAVPRRRVQEAQHVAGALRRGPDRQEAR